MSGIFKKVFELNLLPTQNINGKILLGPYLYSSMHRDCV